MEAPTNSTQGDVPEISIASVVARNNIDALSRTFVSKEVATARDAVKQTARTGSTIEEVKTDLAGARDALNVLTTRIGAARLVAATLAGVSPSGSN